MFREAFSYEESCINKTNTSETIMTLTLRLQTHPFQLVLWTSGTCQSLSSRTWLVQKPNIWYLYIYIYMRMFLQMSIGYLMIFACLAFPEPGRTTLSGTARWPFPQIESSSGGQSKVEGESRFCSMLCLLTCRTRWDWQKNPVLVVVVQEAIMKYFDDNQMHSKYEDFGDWIWIKRSTIIYTSFYALTTLPYVLKKQCKLQAGHLPVASGQSDAALWDYAHQVWGWSFFRRVFPSNLIWFSQPKGRALLLSRHSTMIVGPTGGGKSVVLNCLAEVWGNFWWSDCSQGRRFCDLEMLCTGTEDSIGPSNDPSAVEPKGNHHWGACGRYLWVESYIVIQHQICIWYKEID